ncbi:MAG: 2-oxoglutarate dehydrogenase E1 component [Betaproteobacteria bacterium]|nr:2-oxoglutarate dehydrogenase E1 component [Betaproteobacteria bacterium]MBK8687242.1 2-oxoglutarate dehydrogenase E1 component [Betaproteobacteria bacterium]
MSNMKTFEATSTLFGGNVPFIEEQYESYLADPGSVAADWRAYFDTLRGSAADVAHAPVIESFIRLGKSRKVAGAMVDAATMHKQVLVLQMIGKFRTLGMFHADLDPLQRAEKPYIADLDLATYGFTEADLDTEFDVGSFKAGTERMRLRDLVQALRDTYCRSFGAEYMYIHDTATKRFIQQRLEPIRSKPAFTAEQRRHVLERLTAAETLERYLHTRYVGQKRFSGEGGDTMTPMLDRLIEKAGAAGVQETVIGMAHRGRLNVLVNTLGKMPADLFSEFEGKYAKYLSAGDVKYHQGFSSHVITPGGPMHLTLAFNPSHLEVVNAVVEGSVRARQHRRGDAKGDQVLPVLIHGDAAVAGQGILQEVLNMAQTRGYYTGGTVHIVVNNQIGFTTSDPRDTRGTLYCTDIAKMVEAPIFHVNGDDPEACLLAVDLAMDYRQQFHKDVFIDLVCFRRLGHNEADEPMVTQPLMYKKINQHPGTRKLYADALVADGVITAAEAEAMIADYRAAMDKGTHTNKTILSNYKAPYSADWSPYTKGHKWTVPADTTVPMKTLKALAKKACEVPSGFKLHPRVERVIADRKAMADGKLALDWGMGETLAYATLLADGYGVRLSGEDVGRGTFVHRHAVLHDQNREKWDSGTWVPLEHLKDGQPTVEIIDSVLTELGVLGFEYGYATSDPRRLVIWEAQFGDFANGAQVVIDQFISAGEAKWGRLCGLVLLLPHGYEGQGPEHSSARPERFLQLCAEHNMQVCVPTTPAQIYHLLRRQMVRPYRTPLVVMSPKSLLRHKEAVSTLEELAEGGFQTVIGETEKITARNVRRVILCSGKVYYELLAHRREHRIADVAIIRFEQLYPFPHDDFKAQLAKFPNAKEIVWCQEEPQNQGAWYRLRAYFRADARPKQLIAYAGRPVSASPAVGYMSKHVAQQKQLIEEAFAPKLSEGEMLVGT